MAGRIITGTEWGTISVKQRTESECDVFAVKPDKSEWFLSPYEGKETDPEVNILNYIDWKIW